VVFGVPLALPLAVLTFFGAFIPIIGALVAGALAVLIALVIQGPATALGVLILILVVQQVEGNLLQPLVQGRGLGLNSALVILAVTAGSSLAGIAGAFLAVPVAAVIAEILRYFGEQIDRRTGEHEEGAGDAAAGDGSPGDGSPGEGSPGEGSPGDGSAGEKPTSVAGTTTVGADEEPGDATPDVPGDGTVRSPSRATDV
jgi:putative heme transporter